ncbi:MAG TPA: hypothetical protein VMH39_10885, partial [Gemmatimonadaceae bacterium]|nr:hypothetical protein [Gemmatimonadaceae bacterium]
RPAGRSVHIRSCRTKRLVVVAMILSGDAGCCSREEQESRESAAATAERMPPIEARRSYRVRSRFA